LSTARWLASTEGFSRYGTHPSKGDLEAPQKSLYYCAAYLYQLTRCASNYLTKEEFLVRAYHAGAKGTASASATDYWLKYLKAKLLLTELKEALVVLEGKEQRRQQRKSKRQWRRQQRQQQQMVQEQQEDQEGVAAMVGPELHRTDSSGSSDGSNITMHVLQKGENLAQVAAVCGTSVDAIIAANPDIAAIGGEQSVQTHDCIAIPVPVVIPRLYVLQPNDTLKSVARAHGVSMGRLLAKNPELVDPSRVQPGWMVRIPGLKGDSQNCFGLEQLTAQLMAAGNSFSRRDGAVSPELTSTAERDELSFFGSSPAATAEVQLPGFGKQHGAPRTFGGYQQHRLQQQPLSAVVSAPLAAPHQQHGVSHHAANAVFTVSLGPAMGAASSRQSVAPAGAKGLRLASHHQQPAAAAAAMSWVLDDVAGSDAGEDQGMRHCRAGVVA
jgi:LysM repeat protein